MAESTPALNVESDLYPKKSFKESFIEKAEKSHNRVPVLRRIPLPAIGIILLVALVNVAVWIAAAVVLVCTFDILSLQ